MSEFKIDDVVTVLDKAWAGAFCIDHIKVVHIDRKCVNLITNIASGPARRFKVIGIGCKIQVKNACYASTLIRELENGIVYAINECNLVAAIAHIGIQYMANGRNVTLELSDQSKNAVLQAHLNSANI